MPFDPDGDITVGRMVSKAAQRRCELRGIPRLRSHPLLDRRERGPFFERVREVRRLDLELFGLLARVVAGRLSLPDFMGEKRTLTRDRVDCCSVVSKRVPVDRAAVATDQKDRAKRPMIERVRLKSRYGRRLG